MFRPYFLILSLFVLFSSIASGDGLSKQTRKQVEGQFKSADSTQEETRLIVARGGIPACMDTVEKEAYVPLGLGKMGPPRASTKTKKRKSQAQVEIKNEQIKVVRTCPYASLLEPGTELFLEDFDLKDDRAELSLRAVAPVMGGPEDFELFSRVDVKLYFDESLLARDDPAAALEAIDQWFKRADLRR